MTMFRPGEPCPRCGQDHGPHEDAACGCGCGQNPIGCIGCSHPATMYMLCKQEDARLERMGDHEWRDEMFEDNSDFDSEMYQD